MKLLPLFVLLLVVPMVQAAQFPASVGYVNDFAGILPNAGALEAILAAYEKNTTIEIAIVTISELPPEHSTATYTVELFEEWGIGKKSEDNGILVLLVKDGAPGARMRIELGYGIQGYITGAEAGRILDDALPSYEAGGYQTAAEIIVAGLKTQLTSYVPGERPEDTPGLIFFLIFIAVFVFIIAFGIIASTRCPYCIRGKVVCTGNKCVCTRCKRKFDKRRRRSGVFVVAGGGVGGGFGGGGSGGGGAGR
ncbi:MAG: TPM domain-containing protein [Nanoarchaeota archaeon]|nr:TPM domain-containing protein [Nanoarchaeota archaeon]